MVRFIIEDRVLGDQQEVFFKDAADAYFRLFATLAGTPKVIDVTQDNQGITHFVIHKYIIRGEENKVLVEK